MRGGLEVRWAVAEDHVVVAEDFVEFASEDALAAGPRRQVEVEEREFEVARDEIEAGDLRDNVVDDAVLELVEIVGLAPFALAADFEDVGHRAVFRRPGGPGFLGHERKGGVGLRIEVDEEHALAVIAGEVGGEIDGDGRLADAAFHVEEGDDDGFGHGWEGIGR